MNTSEKAVTAEPSLAREWLGALRYWLGGRRALMVTAVAVVAAGAVFNWSWLVAAGIAPLLISLLPCAVMCGLGLCMSRMMGGSCSGTKGTADDAAAQGARPEALPAAAAADPNQLTRALDGVDPAAQPAAVAPAAPGAWPEPKPQRRRRSIRRNLKTVIAASSALVIGGLLAAPALYAQAAGEGGMMGQGGMMQEGGPMMGGGGMMGMMEQMNRMMATCNEMMQAHMQDRGPGGPGEPGGTPQGEGAPQLPGGRAPAPESGG